MADSQAGAILFKINWQHLAVPERKARGNAQEKKKDYGACQKGARTSLNGFLLAKARMIFQHHDKNRQ